MRKEEKDQLYFCSFCPNICRINYPLQGIPKVETMTPSALAFLAYSVIRRFVDYTGEFSDTFNHLEGASACAEACPYGINIPSIIQALRKELKNR